MPPHSRPRMFPTEHLCRHVSPPVLDCTALLERIGHIRSSTQTRWTRGTLSDIGCAKSVGQIDFLTCAGEFSRGLQSLSSFEKQPAAGPIRRGSARTIFTGIAT